MFPRVIEDNKFCLLISVVLIIKAVCAQWILGCNIVIRCEVCGDVWINLL